MKEKKREKGVSYLPNDEIHVRERHIDVLYSSNQDYLPNDEIYVREKNIQLYSIFVT